MTIRARLHPNPEVSLSRPQPCRSSTLTPRPTMRSHTVATTFIDSVRAPC